MLLSASVSASKSVTYGRIAGSFSYSLSKAIFPMMKASCFYHI